MIEQAGPPSKQIQAIKQVQEFLKDGDDVILIGVFKGDQDPDYQLYQDAGKYFIFLFQDCSVITEWKLPTLQINRFFNSRY